MAAKSDLRIIVQDETGTGKECVARAVHEWSGRLGPFIGVDSAALPEWLAEVELFGCRRGAFTGADRASSRYLRSAHQGTLLLDEITDLPRAPFRSMFASSPQRRSPYVRQQARNDFALVSGNGWTGSNSPCLRFVNGATMCRGSLHRDFLAALRVVRARSMRASSSGFASTTSQVTFVSSISWPINSLCSVETNRSCGAPMCRSTC
jgi:hypothetical protein